jgi:hypothetical protein
VGGVENKLESMGFKVKEPVRRMREMKKRDKGEGED